MGREGGREGGEGGREGGWGGREGGEGGREEGRREGKRGDRSTSYHGYLLLSFLSSLLSILHIFYKGSCGRASQILPASL